MPKIIKNKIFEANNRFTDADSSYSDPAYVLYNFYDWVTEAWRVATTTPKYHHRTYFHFSIHLFIGPAFTIDLGCQAQVSHLLIKPARSGHWNDQ